MTSYDDNHDPPTVVGAGGEPTTEVPSPSRAAPELAWSAEEPATLPLRQSWRLTWGRAAVLLACAGVVALAIGFAGWALARLPCGDHRGADRGRQRQHTRGDHRRLTPCDPP